MTKQEFFDFAIMMRENSKTLFNEDRCHTSVYLAGYVLEAYIKIILLHKGENAFEGHLGDTHFLQKFRHIISLYPEYSDDLLQESNCDYPKHLFNGQGNNTTKASWKIGHRYKVENWTDSDFGQNVQNEIDKVQNALQKLQIDGVL